MAKKYNIVVAAVNKTKKEFDRVTNGLNKIGGKAKVAAKGVAGVGLAAAGTATAIAALVKVNTDFMDKIGKTSTKLGIQAEFLQQMRFAAEQTGVKVEALDMGLQRFIRRAAEAAQGTGEAKRAFEQLGIQLINNDGTLRNVKDVLFDVADGIKNTGSDAEKVRLAFKFFDSEGVSLVTTLKEGAAGLREFEEQAENLGIIISSNSIKKAEMFADSLNILKKQFQAISANIAGAFLPILQDMSTQISTFMADLKGTDSGFENFGKTIALNIIETFRSATIAMTRFVQDTTIQLKLFQNKFGFGELSDEARDLVFQIKDIEAALKKGIDPFGKNEQVLESLKIRLAEILGLDFNFTKANDFFDMLNKTVTDFKAELKGDDAEDNVIDKTSEKVKAFRDSIGATNDAIANLSISTAKKLEDTLVESLRKGKFAFKDFADYVTEQILRIALQQMIISPIVGSIERGFQSLPFFDGGGYTGMGARAGGIDGKGGFAAVLHPNETVIDHTKGQAIGGATINFNINTVDAGGFDELLTSRKGLITAMINNAMNNQGKMGVV